MERDCWFYGITEEENGILPFIFAFPSVKLRCAIPFYTRKVYFCKSLAEEEISHLHFMTLIEFV